MKIIRTKLFYTAAIFGLIATILLICCTKDSDSASREISDYAEHIGSASILVLKDNNIVYSYGNLEKIYMCHSIRKPFLGALYGIYVNRGIIDLNLTLEELEIDDIKPVLTTDEKQATIRDLLMARSGVYHEAGGEVQSMIDARPERGSHAPGTFFYYNNWDFNALGTIFTKLTGKGIFKAFEEEIAQKIGMEDFSIDDCTYVYESDKSMHSSYFFRMSTRDMARFGRLYQQMGVWEGEQVIPEKWIRESTTVYPISNSDGDPYGYLWRIIAEESGFGRGFYHNGIGVHNLTVIPKQRIVAVHRVDTDKPFDIKWSEIRNLMEMIIRSYELLDLAGD